MNSKKNILIYTGIAVIITVAVVITLLNYISRKKIESFQEGEIQEIPDLYSEEILEDDYSITENTNTNNTSINENNKPEIEKYFPLKKGSKNNYVAKLQVALGITVDKKFGNQTLKFLEEKTGKKEIYDLSELNAIIYSLKINNAANNYIIDKKFIRSQNIIDAYARNNFYNPNNINIF